jgi:hypothetical protein
MDPIATKQFIELELNIEELERKIAPDGSETVLPLRPCLLGPDPGVIDTTWLIQRP